VADEVETLRKLHAGQRRLNRQGIRSHMWTKVRTTWWHALSRRCHTSTTSASRACERATRLLLGSSTTNRYLITMSRVITALCVLSMLGTSCALEGDRDSVVHEALARDNRDLALRDGREVAARFARMAESPFDFFRGSIGLWARDVSTAGLSTNVDSAFVDGVAGGVLLVGDPHPENLGTSCNEGFLGFGFNDFDVARFGPAVLDVRRLALGFEVAFDAVDGLDDGDLVDDVVDGYIDGITGEALVVRDIDAVDDDTGDYGEVVSALFARARKKGAVNDEREDVAMMMPPNDANGDASNDDDAPVLRLDLVDAPPTDLEAEAVVRLSGEEEARLRGVLMQAGLHVRDVGRTVGRGVGSRPLLRYTGVLDDDRLFQLKEARDAFVLNDYAAEHDRFFADNAERVVFARRFLHGDNGGDALLRPVALAPLGGVLTHETAWAQTVRVSRVLEDLTSGKIVPLDVRAFARLAGRVLAASHRRGVDVDGGDVDTRLAAAFDLTETRKQLLRDETRAATAALIDNARADHERLRHLIDDHGPLLGLDGTTP
jgi:uncharacterized protein (DUF2252 family)